LKQAASELGVPEGKTIRETATNLAREIVSRQKEQAENSARNIQTARELIGQLDTQGDAILKLAEQSKLKPELLQALAYVAGVELQPSQYKTVEKILESRRKAK